MAKHQKTDGDETLAQRNGGSQTEEALAENLTYGEDMQALAAELGVTKDMVKADIGFPPYWKADMAKGFRGIILMRDERDPEFVRYHIENTGPRALDCQQGSVDDGVVESVAPGSIFTCSAYGALPLDRFFGFEVVVMVTGSRKLPGNKRSNGVPRDMWEFKVLVKPEIDALLKSRRAEDAKHVSLLQQAAKRKALEEVTLLNAKRLAQRQQAPILTAGESANA